MATTEVQKALADLGGLANVLALAQPAEKTKLYDSLGLRLEYNHESLLVRATAEAVCVPGRVRRGT